MTASLDGTKTRHLVDAGKAHGLGYTPFHYSLAHRTWGRNDGVSLFIVVLLIFPSSREQAGRLSMLRKIGEH